MAQDTRLVGKLHERKGRPFRCRDEDLCRDQRRRGLQNIHSIHQARQSKRDGVDNLPKAWGVGGGGGAVRDVKGGQRHRSIEPQRDMDNCGGDFTPKLASLLPFSHIPNKLLVKRDSKRPFQGSACQLV